jgi:hypothetical protein
MRPVVDPVRCRLPGGAGAIETGRARPHPALRATLGSSPGAGSSPGGRRFSQLTPSLRCRLVDDVVYWNVSFLSGYT